MVAMASDKVRVLVVGEHPLLRLGLGVLLAREPGLELCGEATGDGETLAQVEALRPDLVVLDLCVSPSSGLDLVTRLCARFPRVPVVVCSLPGTDLFAERAVEAGARGVVSATAPLDQILSGVRRVLAGERVGPGGAAVRTTGPRRDALAGLTNRELEVLGFIGDGLGSSEIAARLTLSVKTVESHRENIKRKLNLTSGGELVRFAVQWMLSAR